MCRERCIRIGRTYISGSRPPGSEIIAASSPQAKGRVERGNGVHQDRLVKKLRRQGIQSYAAANEYLEAEYLPEHNRRFAREATRPENYHLRAPSAAKLRQVFRLEMERWISNDWVVQYRGHFLQLQPPSKRYGPTRAKALVCEWEDGTVEVRYRGDRMEYEELMVRPQVSPGRVGWAALRASPADQE